MTAISRIFERRGSSGWVIIAGEAPPVRGSDSSALDPIINLLREEGALVILAPGGEIPSSTQHFVNDLLARFSGSLKIVDPLDVDQQLILETCRQAQVVLAIGGKLDDWVTIINAERLPADPDSIVAEHSLFIAMGSLISVLGEWIYDSDSDQITDGIGWFPKAIFLPGLEAPASIKGVQQKIETQMKSYAISIAPDTIIGVGPQGKVEIWSDAAPEILLGKGWV
ncbi:MAG: hypothetical protein GQ524_03815 [Anaerolineales bacterium]|nr:hypothetical protein [Anaerolineales bacterium]